MAVDSGEVDMRMMSESSEALLGDAEASDMVAGGLGAWCGGSGKVKAGVF